MNRTHIVFVQPLKMLDVTSALTPFLTHAHTLMLQYVIRSKQRIHTNGCYFGVRYLSQGYTHSPCAMQGSRTSVFPELSLYFLSSGYACTSAAQKRLSWKAELVVVPSHRSTGDGDVPDCAVLSGSSTPQTGELRNLHMRFDSPHQRQH